jgi:hypothetical protein
MNNQQFTDALSITQSDDPNLPYISVRAAFRLYREAKISRDLLLFSPNLDIIGQVNKQLANDIVHDLYDDRRSELYKAVAELCNANPCDTSRWYEVRTDLIKAATRQPDATIDSIMDRVNAAEERKRLRARIKKLEKQIEILRPTKPIIDFSLGD